MDNLVPLPLELCDYRDDGKDTRRFTLKILADKFDQNIVPGQFFMLSVPGTGEAPFTYVTPPNSKGEFQALVRRTGEVTNKLFQLKRNITLGYRGPFGNSWPQPSETDKVLIIAGGCGLAPLAAWVNKYANNNPTGKPANFALIYGAQDIESQMLSRELQEWRSNLKLTETLDKQTSETHHAEKAEETPKEKANYLQGNPVDHLSNTLDAWGQQPTKVLICGPESMMFAAANKLVDTGIQANKIYLSMERRMHCANGTCGHCYIGHTYVCKDGPVYDWATLRTLI